MMQLIANRTRVPGFDIKAQGARLRLAPQIFMASIGDRAVILDLARDKYLALNPALAEAARELIGMGCGASYPQAAREKLIADGFLTEAPRQERDQQAERTPETPPRSLWPSNPGDFFGPKPIPLMAFVTVQWALRQASWSLKHRTFQETVSWISRQQASKPRSRPRSTQQLLDEFFAARPWFPEKPICRLDALALCYHLRRNGRDAALVFGVKLEPFEAHCWVHAGGAIINEPHEVVSKYTPIMAV